MKYLLIFSFILGGCKSSNMKNVLEAKDAQLVVSDMSASKFIGSGKYKYSLHCVFYLKDLDIAGHYDTYYLYSDSLYNVGDTLKIVK